MVYEVLRKNGVILKVERLRTLTFAKPLTCRYR